MSTKMQHAYAPRGACKRLFTCRKSEVLLSGPAGTGKSRACLEKLHLMALLYPGMRGLIARKTLSSLGSTALVTWRKFIISEALATGLITFYGGSAEEAPQYRYANGSVITIGGLDKATKIMSAEYDMIYVQEAIELTKEDWESLTTRLRNWRMPWQQLIADTNPSSNTHWLIQREDVTVLESRHTDNPQLYSDSGELTERGKAYMDKLDKLTGVRRHRLRDGLWVAAEGIVYESYDPAAHLIDRFDIPEEWTRLWVVDFGFRNPFVWQSWAEDHDGKLFRYREIYQTKLLVEDAAKEIARVTEGEPRPSAIICDHDAEDRATLQRHLGMMTTAANKTVSDGIQAVQVRLNEGRLFLLRDSLVSVDPGLLEAAKPTCTEEEFPGYIWDGRVSLINGPKETPVKQDDHGMDTTRYVVADRDLVGKPNIRWL